MKYIIILFVVLLLILFKVYHIHIKWKSLFHKGFRPDRSQFGVYCFCGKQGSGKTLSLVTFLNENKNMKIYANIKSLKGIDYTYFNGFDELLSLRNEQNCIIVYDEIFTALTRTSKMNTDVLDFLSQMRKRKIIFLTTAQEWLEINITLRRYCRWQVDCSMIPFFNTGFIIKRFYNAELMHWDNLENDYVAPLTDFVIEKTNLKIANSYDTFEQIKT